VLVLDDKIIKKVNNFFEVVICQRTCKQGVEWKCSILYNDRRSVWSAHWGVALFAIFDVSKNYKMSLCICANWFAMANVEYVTFVYEL